ncbi:MAG: PEP-CTERM sorting domain-containing protein [Planctomycetota bacterium]
MKIPALLILIALLLGVPVQADIIYSVVPYQLSGGFAITGGTITTNDAMDTITAWQVEVTGPRGYVFSDTNPGAMLRPEEFNITPTEIAIADLFGNTTGFAATDNSSADCTDCMQSLSYISSGGPTTSYLFRDFSDGNPEFPAAVNQSISSGITVATLVPEPSSLAVLGLGGLIAARRRR